MTISAIHRLNEGESAGQQCDVREAGLARVLKWTIADSGSVITDVIRLALIST